MSFQFYRTPMMPPHRLPPSPARHTPWWCGLVLVAAALLAAGCVRVPSGSEADADVTWDRSVLVEHVQLLNAPGREGRATGSLEYDNAADYVRARLEDFELQPAAGADYLTRYALPINRPLGGALVAIGADTINYQAGVDFVVDGRSDARETRVRYVRLSASPDGLEAPVRDDVAWVASARAVTDEALQAFRDAGGRVVFLLGEGQRQLASGPVDDLAILRVDPAVLAASLRGRMPPEAETWGAASMVALQHLLLVRTEVDYLRRATGVNVMGYVPGRNPAYARQLVIVCSDLDGPGVFANAPYLSTHHMGAGTAALLGLAEWANDLSQYWNVPERTALFAVWSGARLGLAGLRSYLARPVWPLERTHAVIYLSADTTVFQTASELLAPHGIPLYGVHPDSLSAPATWLAGGRRAGGSARETSRTAPSAAPAVERPTRSMLVEQAVEQALDMVQQSSRLFVRETLSQRPSPLPRPSELRLPIGTDSLRVNRGGP